MAEELEELEEQLMLKKKKKNATRRMEQIIRLHTEGNRAKLDQARNSITFVPLSLCRERT
jgi:hypothetical protein